MRSLADLRHVRGNADHVRQVHVVAKRDQPAASNGLCEIVELVGEALHRLLCIIGS